MQRFSRLALYGCIPLLFASLRFRTKDCSKDTYGAVPLTELGAGQYLGESGGLYPGGSNTMPPFHAAAGRQIALQRVVPRDPEGSPNSDGVVGLISIGLSNTTQEFQVFLDLIEDAPDVSPDLLAVDCAKGGVGLEDAVDPGDPKNYWPFVDNRLAMAGLDPDQVQVVWLKTAYGSPPSLVFPHWQQEQAMDLATLVRILRERFPNLALCYVSSRIYGHYSMSPVREEPTAYESGFGFKWLIEGQLQGLASLNYDPALGPVVAPWLAWGPYLWADGVNPRSDGLTWLCDDFVEDGHHPSDSGRLKVARRLLAFFRSAPTTRPWFLRPHPADRTTGPPARGGSRRP